MELTATSCWMSRQFRLHQTYCAGKTTRRENGRCTAGVLVRTFSGWARGDGRESFTATESSMPGRLLAGAKKECLPSRLVPFPFTWPLCDLETSRHKYCGLHIHKPSQWLRIFRTPEPGDVLAPKRWWVEVPIRGSQISRTGVPGAATDHFEPARWRSCRAV